MTMDPKPRSRGFSLVELLTVVAILGIVMTAVYSIFVAHQRTAYVDEEVVDVQQNLRIAMDSIGRDIKMSGFLIRDDLTPDPNQAAPGDLTVPVARYDNNALAPLGQLQPLPAPNNVQSDSITLNMASAESVYARVIAEVTAPVSPGTGVLLPVDSVDYLSVENPRQIVRIYDSANFSGPRDAGGSVDTRTYTVEKVLTAAGACGGGLSEPCVELIAGGATATTITYGTGFIIARIENFSPEPNQVRYSLVSGAGCPAGPLCLQRTSNPGTPAEQNQVIAMNIAGLQLSYLLDDAVMESDAPSNLSLVRAVRVTIWGQTLETNSLSDRQPRTRQASTVVKIRNRQGS